jgi:hypothetical protein
METERGERKECGKKKDNPIILARNVLNQCMRGNGSLIGRGVY